MPDARSLTGRRWILPSGGDRISQIARHLARERNINLSLSPSWKALCDPSLLGDLSEAVERIRQALRRRENIGIIGDYDCDGVTGVAQLVRFFRRHGTEPHVLLPHREKHGYGVKREFIEDLHRKGVTLVLTVDTGISHSNEIALARSLGMDVVVTDHHSPRSSLPDALIVHPTAKGKHDNTFLSGSGVVFTLIRALEDGEWVGKEEDIALAAVGTVADVVPLLEENRTIVQLGLYAMMKESEAPIVQLVHSVVQPNVQVTSTHIAYRIAPRINAAGRIADPMIALEALLSGGDPLSRLQTLNDERRDATNRMMEIAGELCDRDLPLCIARSEVFHPGIIGLIAGKLTETSGKPGIVCSQVGDTLTCSLRSIPSYDVSAALKRCSACLMSFGGHPMAGGCTLKTANWEDFSGALLCDAGEMLNPDTLVPSLPIDLPIEEEALTLETVRSLKLLEPFGAGNPEPRFLIKHQKLSWVKEVGRNGDHLQCRVGNTKAIGFRLGHLTKTLPENVDIVCRLGVDTWRGEERVQIFIEDVAEAQGAMSPMTTTIMR